MPHIKIIGFSGEIPRTQPRMLPDTASQLSQNVRLLDGGLVPIRQSRYEFTLTGVADAIKTIYRYQENWLAWPSIVNCAPGPVATDRLYYTGDGVPKMRIGDDVYPLAVPYPTVALTGSTSAPQITRIYYYSNVDTNDVESAPSPPLTATYDANNRVKLAGFLVPGSTIAKQRIYRTQDGATYLVYERTAATTNYTDIEDTPSASKLPVASAVAAPTTALTYTLTPKDITTRFYVYTYVSSLGEESVPSPASNEISWQDGQIVTLSGFTTPGTDRLMTKQRIYRTQTTSSTANFYFIAERDASTADFVDDYKVDDFAEILPSADWDPPPDNLDGLITLPNGMMCAFFGKTICFSEPYYPHAWPVKYQLTISYNAVALGSFGTTVAVMTDGQPYVLTGTSPGSMSQEKIQLNLPCINRRGVVDMGYATVYPSNDGLVSIGTDGPKIVTASLFTREDWLALSPGTFVAGQYSARYYASYNYVDDLGVINEGTIIIDLSGEQPFINRTTNKADAYFYDLQETELYQLRGKDIYQYDSPGQSNEIMTWKSKRFVLADPVNMGAMRIDGSEKVSSEEQMIIDQNNATIKAANELLYASDSVGGALNASAVNVYTVNGDGLQKLQDPKYISVLVIADDVVVANITEINVAKRLPNGYKARVWEILVNGTSEISQIVIAQTMKELKEAQ